MIHLTDAARHKVLALLAGEDRAGLALRLAIDGRVGGSYRYQLGFVSPAERTESDTVQDGGGFELFVDADSAPNLDGTSIDYIETLQESGFKIDNPNSPWKDPIAAAAARVIDLEINPAIASHGGVVTLREVRDGIAYLEIVPLFEAPDEPSHVHYLGFVSEAGHA